MIDLLGVVGSSRHLGVWVPFFSSLARREYPAVLDSGRIVAAGSRVVGNGIPCLPGPFGEHITGLLKGLGMLGILRQVGELMGVVVDLEEFLRRARVGEYLMLLGVGLAGGMGLP